MIWEVCIQIRKTLWSCNTSRKLIFKKLGVIVLKVNDQFLEPALSDCSVIRVIKRVWCCWKHEYKPIVESVEFAVTTAHVLRRMNVVCTQTERRETCVRVCSGQLVSMLCCVVWSVGQYVVLCGLVSWSVCPTTSSVKLFVGLSSLSVGTFVRRRSWNMKRRLRRELRSAFRFTWRTNTSHDKSVVNCCFWLASKKTDVENDL